MIRRGGSPSVAVLLALGAIACNEVIEDGERAYRLSSRAPTQEERAAAAKRDRKRARRLEEARRQGV